MACRVTVQQVETSTRSLFRCSATICAQVFRNDSKKLPSQTPAKFVCPGRKIARAMTGGSLGAWDPVTPEASGAAVVPSFGLHVSACESDFSALNHCLIEHGAACPNFSVSSDEVSITIFAEGKA
jgi:hypothetical protein